MSEELTITITGLKEFEQKIENFTAKLDVALNREETKMTIGEILVARGRHNIDTAGTELDPPWKPLAESTIAARSRREMKKKPGKRKNKQGIVSNQPLVDTGIGRSTLSYKTNEGGLSLIGKKYMAYQHFGTKRIPARPIFTLHPQDIADIKQLILDDIRSQL